MFALLLLLSWLSPLSAQPPENSPALSALQEKASRDGSVRIVVQLDTSFTPEGNLKSAQARQQRLGIAQAQAALLDRIPADQIRNHREFSFTPLMAMEVTSSGLQTLMAGSGWTQIHEDKQYRMSLAQSAPLVGSTLIQSQGFGGAGQTVAVIDTGVDANHPFLAGKVVAEACFSTTLNPGQLTGSTTACPNGSDIQIGAGAARPYATNIAGREHGTHVAGIAAGGNPGIAFTGVAPDANLIAIQAFSIFKNLNCGGKQCAFLYLSDGIAALEHVYSLRNTFNIASVNMSFGGGAFSSPCNGEPLKLPVDLLRSVQIASISSSGNESSSFALSSPACISSVVSVGSTTKSDTVSSFSNSASFLDLLAPGGSIQSSVPGTGYSVFSGTSMASPHVAGAWAVMKGQIPTRTINQILENFKLWGVPVLDARNGLTKPRLLIILDSDGDGVGDIDDAFPNDPDETADTDGDGIGDNGDAFPLAPARVTLLGTMSGTKFCVDGSGTVKQKFVDAVTIIVDFSTFPVMAAEVQMTNPFDLFDLTGMALLRNPKSGVLQLFGDDGGPKKMALSGNIKLDKKTQALLSLKGKFQFQDTGTPACTLAGKLKAK
jgi:subtilisin family serine protease